MTFKATKTMYTVHTVHTGQDTLAIHFVILCTLMLENFRYIAPSNVILLISNVTNVILFSGKLEINQI